MLRVIAGQYKSRKIKDVPSKLTRPTTDKNKEVIFNSIGQFFNGGKVLDLFAGSGSLGIEALSRGMSSCDFVDKQYTAIKVIQENIDGLNLKDQSKIIKKDAIQYLKNTQNSYDLILLDPPYKLKPYQEVLDLIASRQLLNNHGIIVMESDHQTTIQGIQDIQVIKEKTLGQSKITILERNIL
jgi:16S rRNA (guanine966-N2)-methyltransferase